MAVVAVDHRRGIKPSASSQRCRLLSLGNFPDNIIRHHPASSLSVVHRSFSTPCISASFRVRDEADSSQSRVEILAGGRAPGVRALAVEMTIALTSSNKMVQTDGGLGGAYHLRNSRGRELAIVKPIDEFQQLVGLFVHQPSVSRLVQAGETGVREVAAYLLDHHGFAGVPPTTLVKLPHHVPPMIASAQRFVPHDFDAGDLGPSRFSVSAVRRIGILDVRILNIDRHAGNILVKKSCVEENNSPMEKPFELVPIDHGLCLPESLEDPYFEWLHWPQASTPFSEAELDYIRKLDPLKDAQILRNELPMLREASIRIFILCTIFLKRAAEAGLCLTDIGGMMTREFSSTDDNERSMLEILCHEAMALSNLIVDEIDHEESAMCNPCKFDIEWEEGGSLDPSIYVMNVSPHLSSLPPLGKPPRVPLKLSSSISMREYREGSSDEKVNNNSGFDDESKPLRLMTKSLSISAIKESNEVSGISFINMSESQWHVFLVKFEEILLKAFRSRKNVELKRRFGSSCVF